MIRLGLVGCGAWGANYVRSAWETGIAEVTHVYRLTKMPGRDVVVVGSLDQLLEAPVDAVVVATPPAGRVDICEEIIASERPLLVEKPLALSFAEADHIVRAAERARLPLLVGHQHLFAPAFEELLWHIPRPTRMKIVSRSGGPGPVRSYSALWDYGPHDVAMVLGALASRWPEMLACESADGVFDLKFGTELHTADIRVSNTAPEKVRLFDVTVHDGRRLRYDDSKPDGKKLTLNGAPVDTPTERPLTKMIRTFAEACRWRSADWRFGRFGADVVRLLEEAEVERKRHVDDQDPDLGKVVR